MDIRLQSATVGGFAVAGGGNGVVATRLAWHKVPRTLRRSRPRTHGSVDLSRYYDGRFYELAGLLYGVSEEDAQARLDAFEEAVALDGESVDFVFQVAGRLEPEHALVRIDGDLDYAFDSQERGLVRWALTLFAEDPRRYGTTARSGSYDPTTAASGSGLFLPIQFSGLVNHGVKFSNANLGPLSVTNAGNYPTPPVFTIAGPVTNPIIDNDTTGESITVEGLELLDGETVVIDVAAKTLTVNGTPRSDLIDASGTDWFELVKGVNLLRMRGIGMVTGHTELAVSFYDARI